jgi:hypothetical protein
MVLWGFIRRVRGALFWWGGEGPCQSWGLWYGGGGGWPSTHEEGGRIGSPMEN